MGGRLVRLADWFSGDQLENNDDDQEEGDDGDDNHDALNIKSAQKENIIYHKAQKNLRVQRTFLDALASLRSIVQFTD